MKIIFASLPVGGHLNPLLGMASYLAAAGHDVRVYTGMTMRGRVLSLGLGFDPLPASVDFDFSDVDKAFPGRAACAPGPERAQFDFEQCFLAAMDQQYRGLEALLEIFPADVIIAESFFYGTVPLKLNLKHRAPHLVTCGVTVSTLPRPDHAPWGPGLPFAADAATRDFYRDTLAPTIALQQAPTQDMFDAELERLGAQPIAGHFLDATRHVADAYLQCGVPGLEYPCDSLPDKFHYLGLPLQTAGAFALPSWAADLDRYRRVVLVTQGTIANADLEQLVLPTIRALADLPETLVIGTGGGRDTALLQATLPSNARLADYLPFDWLMPKLDVLVTNGGFGTVLQALSVGVPIVVAGTTEDKSEVSARIAFSGVGIDLKTDTPEPTDLAAAVLTILDDSSYRQRAGALAAEFRTYDGKGIITRAIDSAISSSGHSVLRMAG